MKGSLKERHGPWRDGGKLRTFTSVGHIFPHEIGKVLFYVWLERLVEESDKEPISGSSKRSQEVVERHG